MAERKIQRNIAKRKESNWRPQQSNFKDPSVNQNTSEAGPITSNRDKGKEPVWATGQSSSYKGSRKPDGSWDIHCFICGQKGHVSRNCPQRGVNLTEANGEKQPVYDQFEDAVEEEIVQPVEGEALVIRRVLITPRVGEEDWRRHNIFRTRVLCKGKVCDVILDGGSSENIISNEVARKLGLILQKLPRPYKVAWFQKGSELPVNKHCHVPFTLDGGYENEAWCDVAPMDVCHILLGRPWLFDRNMTHFTTANTYSYKCGNKTLVLHPLKEVPTSNAKANNLVGLIGHHKLLVSTSADDKDGWYDGGTSAASSGAEAFSNPG